MTKTATIVELNAGRWGVKLDGGVVFTAKSEAACEKWIVRHGLTLSRG